MRLKHIGTQLEMGEKTLLLSWLIELRQVSSLIDVGALARTLFSVGSRVTMVTTISQRGRHLDIFIACPLYVTLRRCVFSKETGLTAWDPRHGSTSSEPEETVERSARWSALQSRASDGISLTLNVGHRVSCNPTCRARSQQQSTHWLSVTSTWKFCSLLWQRLSFRRNLSTQVCWTDFGGKIDNCHDFTNRANSAFAKKCHDPFSLFAQSKVISSPTNFPMHV